jgi:site-specific recombinase XerD
MDLFKLKREFLEHCELEKGQSVLTINSYSRYLDRFFVFLDEQKKEANRSEETTKESIQASDITPEVVREYRLHINRLKDREGNELKRVTQNYHMLALRAFLRYLAWRGISSLSPEKIPVARAQDREINFLESDEVKNIIDIPDDSALGLRDKAILETLFSTGMRVSELVSLNVAKINLDRGEISVLGKGKKVRVVFLSDTAKELLSQYLKSRSYNLTSLQDYQDIPLFVSNRGGRLTARSIERMVKKCANLAGITKKVSPHTLRHSFATDLLIAGADIRSVQSMLGHSSITTTQVYTHVTDQHLRDIHQKFHGKSLDSEESQVESGKWKADKEGDRDEDN